MEDAMPNQDQNRNNPAGGQDRDRQDRQQQQQGGSQDRDQSGRQQQQKRDRDAQLCSTGGRGSDTSPGGRQGCRDGHWHTRRSASETQTGAGGGPQHPTP